MNPPLSQTAHLPPWCLLFGLLLGLLPATLAQADFSGRVAGVLEGDLLDIRHGSQVVRIRLAGIDAPEPEQRFAGNARQHLAAMIGNRQVQVQELGMDRQGYPVARLVVNGVDQGLAQIEAGMAWYFDGPYPRLSAEQTRQYRQAEAEARKTRQGLWRDLNPLAPWEWNLMRQRSGRGR
jgi:endonuclease YncB( thermonuclease family)